MLAVSGGTDSLALLLATATVRKALGREIVVAHFSHGIRKSAEKREAALVRRIVRALDVHLVNEQAETNTSEASAREARYGFFARVATSRGATALATAHTMNDQAETLLLHLSRGSGLRGAGAIRQFSRREVNGEGLTLLRPILSASRANTEAVCAEWEWVPASDGTNRSVRYARNRVRLRVLPELAQINPEVAGALAAFASSAQEDDDLLTRLASEAIGEWEQRSTTDVNWPTQSLRELPAPLTARVIQSAWAVLRGEGAVLTRPQIDTIKQLLSRGSGTAELGVGATFVVEHNVASLTTRVLESRGFPATALRLPGQTIVGSWIITTEVIHAGVRGEINDSAWRATLDLDALADDIGVRARIDGDRFRPLGMAQEVRLQDVLVNAKVPRSQRDNRPLVVAGERIAWVAGVRIADWAKVTNKTTRVVVIEARPAS